MPAFHKTETQQRHLKKNDLNNLTPGYTKVAPDEDDVTTG
jgi:hypothetical protein